MDNVSLVCIKNITELHDCSGELFTRYINFFKIGSIYQFQININNIEIEIEDKDFFSYIDISNNFSFHKYEIDEHFIPLDKWRELQINKIIND